ncbi:MAG: hypothetical protein GOU97_00415, partial [Nanoarchaeota archaeon]|nr:hypothetical protein [Nanoarchaeota archaeon]
IPASAFLMLAVSSQDRKKVLLPAIFFTAACLIRYPFGAFLPAILLLFRDWKKAGSFLTLVTVLSAPWLLYNFLEFGNPLHSMTAQWEYTSANQDVNPVFYLLSIPESFGFILLPLFLVRKKDLKKLLPLFLFILFYSFFLAGFNHKESRFLIPLIPFVCLASARVLSQKKFGAQAVLFLVLASSIFFLALSPLPSANHETVLELADFFSDKQGVVITPYWPLVAYHANLTVHGPTTPIYREYWIDEWNVSWVVSEESLKTSFLKERKVIYGKSDTLYVYEVIQ